MSRKSLADKKAALYDFKRSFRVLAVPAIVSLLNALYLFVYQIIHEFLKYKDANALSYIEDIRKNIAICLTSSSYSLFFEYYGRYETSVITGISAIIIGVLFAFVAYLFLMKKKNVNVFLSLSVDRKTIFKNRTIAAVILMAVTSIIPIAIDVLINIHYIGDAGYILYHGVFLFLEYFTYMLIGFSMMSIAMTICNTAVESLFFGAGFIWAPTAIAVCIQSLCTTFLRGYANTNLLANDTISRMKNLLNQTTIFNPVFFSKPFGNYSTGVSVITFVSRGVKNPTSEYAVNVKNFDNYGRDIIPFEYILPIIIWLAASVVLLAISRKILLKRKAENAGLHGVRVFPNAFFAIEVSAISSTFIAYILTNNEMGNNVNKYLSLFISVIAFALIYYILMCLSKRKIKLNKATIMPGAYLLCTFFVANLLLISGLFGYAEKTPAISDIKYATIESNIGNYTGNESNASGSIQTQYYLDTFSSTDSNILGVFKDKEDLQKFIEVNKDLAKNTNNMKPCAVTITYKLNDGKAFTRSFYDADYNALYNILSLTDTNAYNEELKYLLSSKQKHNILGLDQKYSGVMYEYVTEENYKAVLHTKNAKLVSADGLKLNSINNTDALKDAILADRIALSYEDTYNSKEKPLGYVLFLDEKYYKTNEAISNGEEYDSSYNGYYETLRYYIYPSCKNTIKYLMKTGEYSLLTEDNSLEKYNITTARVKKYSDILKQNKETFRVFQQYNTYIFKRSAENILLNGNETADENLSDGESINEFDKIYSNAPIFTDKKQLKELSAASVIFGYANDDDYVVLFENERGVMYTSLLRKDNIPKFVK